MVSAMAERGTRPPRFGIGDVLRVDDRRSIGHCRTPVYVRGKTGEVTEIQGLFHDPATLAYNRPGLPMRYWYKLRFRQTDLWPGYKGDPGDHLELDVQEDWLEKAKAGGR
jgi:hypothetical protein